MDRALFWVRCCPFNRERLSRPYIKCEEGGGYRVFQKGRVSRLRTIHAGEDGASPRVWTAADVVLILAAVGVAAVLLFGRPAGGDQLIAVVTVRGNEALRIDLAQVGDAYTEKIEGDVLVLLEVEPGRIRFLSSRCPDQICVDTGWLTQSGQTAVCLPARVAVTLAGAGGAPDATTR